MHNASDEDKKQLRQPKVWGRPEKGFIGDNEPKKSKIIIENRKIKTYILTPLSIIFKIIGILIKKTFGVIIFFGVIAEKRRIMNTDKSDIIKMKEIESLREESHKQGVIDYNDPFWRNL